MQQNEFSEKIMVYKHKMFRFALSYLKDHEDARDVVQEVMLKLWETREQLHEKNSIEAWCMSLTRNKALDRIKQVGRKMKTTMDEVNPNMHSDQASPLHMVADKESIGHINSLLGKLPEKQRAAFQLRDIEGFAYMEISELLGIDMNQVKVNIFRARKMLRENLQTIYEHGI